MMKMAGKLDILIKDWLKNMLQILVIIALHV